MLSVASLARVSRAVCPVLSQQTRSIIKLGPMQETTPQDVLVKEKPRPFKYVPPEQIVDLEVTGEGDAMRATRATVASYRGKVYVELREWDVWEEDDELMPSGVGINMTLNQFNALRQALPQIEKLVEKVKDDVKKQGWTEEAEE